MTPRDHERIENPDERHAWQVQWLQFLANHKDLFRLAEELRAELLAPGSSPLATGSSGS